MAETMRKNVKESKLGDKRRKWVAKPILGPEFTEEISLQEVYVGLLKEKRLISTAIRSISSTLPAFTHLKRCSANRLLLTPLHSPELVKEIRGTDAKDDVLTEDEVKRILTTKGFDIGLLEDRLEILRVPGKVPRTKQQAAVASKIWPVNFHPDPNVESLIDGSVFHDDQLRLIENYMSLAIEAARLEAVGNKECHGSAVIVDPEDGRTLAVAAARIDRHPMWHAAMIAVDLVAKLQGGGAWDLKKNFSDLRGVKPDVTKPSNISCTGENESSTRLVSNLSDHEAEDTCVTTRNEVSSRATDFQARQRRIKRKYEEEAPLFYPPSLSAIPTPPSETLLRETKHRGRKNSGSTADASTESKNSTEKCGPYLCTGYWVFLLSEPCPLCAMALLHSRVGRIFYGTENESAGVLGSRGTLHAVPGLNHRYQVWSGVLAEECRKVLGQIDSKRVS